MLRYGVAVGLLSCVTLYVSSRLIAAHPQLGLYAQLLAELFLVAGLYLGLRAHFERRMEISVREAIRVGLGIGLVSAAIAAAFSWIYSTWLDRGFMDTLVSLYRRQMVEQGFRPEDIERGVARMRQDFSIWKQMLSNASQWLTVSVVVSAVLGSLFRRTAIPGTGARP